MVRRRLEAQAKDESVSTEGHASVLMTDALTCCGCCSAPLILFLLLGGLRAFERASVATIKSLLAWIAALAGISLALLLLLSGRGRRRWARWSCSAR